MFGYVIFGEATTELDRQRKMSVAEKLALGRRRASNTRVEEEGKGPEEENGRHIYQKEERRGTYRYPRAGTMKEGKRNVDFMRSVANSP